MSEETYDTVGKAWIKFTHIGWDFDRVPSKKECFEAGWNAAVADMKDKAKWKDANEHVEIKQGYEVE